MAMVAEAGSNGTAASVSGAEEGEDMASGFYPARPGSTLERRERWERWSGRVDPLPP